MPLQRVQCPRDSRSVMNVLKRLTTTAKRIPVAMIRPLTMLGIVSLQEGPALRSSPSVLGSRCPILSRLASR